MNRKPLLTLTCLIITGCATPQKSYEYYLQNKGITTTTTENFQHCHGYGCQRVTDIQFNKSDWKEINALFTPPSPNAETERKRIAEAIGLFETKVGAIAGTENDRYGTFHKLGEKQLDCVDESTNTTIYLTLLQSKKFITHHSIEAPSVRLPIINAGLWPHQTAIITDTKTNIPYIVDSWFHDNGYPAEIVPLSEWKKGWEPKTPKRHGDSSNKGE